MNTAAAINATKSPRTRRPRSAASTRPTTAATTADAIADLIALECAALAPDLCEMSLDTDDAKLALASLSIRGGADINTIGAGLRDAIRCLQKTIAAALEITDHGAAAAGLASNDVRNSAQLIVRASTTLARVYSYDLAIACGEVK